MSLRGMVGHSVRNSLARPGSRRLADQMDGEGSECGVGGYIIFCRQQPKYEFTYEEESA